MVGERPSWSPGAGGAAVKYLLLIYDDESVWSSMSEEDSQAIMGEYFAYSEKVFGAGAAKAGDALQPTATATTVRVRDGQTLTTDGPFAETKEQLGGYYLLDVANLDEAIEWASRIPSARWGSIEVRPLMEFPDMAASSEG
jgi:hypothetical protein